MIHEQALDKMIPLPLMLVMFQKNGLGELTWDWFKEAPKCQHERYLAKMVTLPKYYAVILHQIVQQIY